MTSRNVSQHEQEYAAWANAQARDRQLLQLQLATAGLPMPQLAEPDALKIGRYLKQCAAAERACDSARAEARAEAQFAAHCGRMISERAAVQAARLMESIGQLSAIAETIGCACEAAVGPELRLPLSELAYQRHTRRSRRGRKGQ